MYRTLEHDRTRKYFKYILDETIGLIENDPLLPTPLYQSFLHQLYDIKEKVVEKGIYANADWEVIYDRYTLGVLAMRYLPDGEEMQLRIFDIFWGTVHYSELPEE